MGHSSGGCFIQWMFVLISDLAHSFIELLDLAGTFASMWEESKQVVGLVVRFVEKQAWFCLIDDHREFIVVCLASAPGSVYP